MVTQSVTDKLIGQIIKWMDDHDMQPLIFQSSVNLGYTCIGACRSVAKDFNVSHEYYMTVGVAGIGLINDGPITLDHLKEALRICIEKGLRPVQKSGEVPNLE